MSFQSHVDPNQHDRFVLRQKFRMVVNEFEVAIPAAGGDAPGAAFCFVRQ